MSPQSSERRANIFRFHQIPSFGTGSIRRFPPNVSEVRQYAAQNFENILQVSKTEVGIHDPNVLNDYYSAQFRLLRGASHLNMTT